MLGRTRLPIYERVGVPFIVDPDGRFDVRMNRFWTSVRFASLDSATQVSYAAKVAVFLDFLSYGRGGKSWTQATSEDRSAYHYYRTMDPNGPRVETATWNLETFAVASFYDFHESAGHVGRSPIEKDSKTLDTPFGRQTRDVPVELGRTKIPKSPWFTNREYEEWKRYGLRGYRADGRRDPSFRGEQSARNIAYSDLMFGTGMRLQEQSSLLVNEIPPRADGWLYRPLRINAAIAKNGSERDVYVARDVLTALVTYFDSDRRDAVETAQGSGAYDRVQGRLLVDPRDPSRFQDETRRWVPTAKATPDERLRMFVERNGELEPVLAFLTRSGMPIRTKTMQGIFAEGNERATNQGSPLRANPHKLRHSWATITMARLRRRYNFYSLHETGREIPFIGSPQRWVSERLGHRHLETTKRYIHSIEGLEGTVLQELIPDTDPLIAMPRQGDFTYDEYGLIVA